VADTQTTPEAATSAGGPTDEPVRGEPTVIVDDVSMIYRVYSERRPSLRELVAGGFKQREYREIQAVRNVSFTAYTGEVIGVIGRNGSGKSTLLRGIAGLQPVTAGLIHVVSDPILLGVGAALQQNLSARRNIELGTLALGMSRAEVEGRIDDIAEFAGLEDYLDLPLKAYSSGMRARLHFAIATAVEPNVLLIDEALAVGDEDFREKSQERIAELRAKAGTVFIVSHSLTQILDMCNRALWIETGKVRRDGEPKKVVRAYKDFVEQRKREKRAKKRA
jgi:teichoic acid transport system ATP-binding protein